MLALREKEFCSMDAGKALENDVIMGLLFYNCSFHSAKKIDNNLNVLDETNPIWKELNCSA